MARKKAYLEDYKRFMETGRMDAMGLCSQYDKEDRSDRKLKIMRPDSNDLDNLRRQGLPRRYWGYGFKISPYNTKEFFTFTPLRQTILLFMAALNNEL